MSLSPPESSKGAPGLSSASLPASPRRPELLAPAGTEESFVAALASGADAVYLGLREGFNARSRSTAFSLELLPELVRRAHAAKVRLYLTLNTLVFERELSSLERLLRQVIASGVDALIVQDPATALLAQALCPELRVHASTQMTISSPEAALFARSLGVRRVVLPRELNVREIELFLRQSELETEVFVHGALCMAWSGQCLTSEALSDRSANRGQCSQACRMPYEAIVDGERRELGDKRYLLSPQDLAAHEVLPELVEAGVHSLKIEGRYKGPSYVSATVDSYKSLLDALENGTISSDQNRIQRTIERAQLTFSRGASPGFLRGDNHQRLVVGTTPKHRGLPLGTVHEIRGKRVIIDLLPDAHTHELVRPGVGIKFEPMGQGSKEHDPENAPGGPVFEVQRPDPRRIELTFGNPGPDLGQVRPGDHVRLTGDPEINRDVERRLSRPLPSRLALRLEVRGRRGESLSVEASTIFDGRRLSAIQMTEVRLEPTRAGGGLDRALLLEKLCGFGGTPFLLETLELGELEAGLYIPVSELKRLRRELTRALEVQLATSPYAAPLEQPLLEGLRRQVSARLLDNEGPVELVALCRTDEQLEAVIASAPPPGTEVELDWMEMVGLGQAVRRARESGLRVTLATVRVQKPGEEAFDRRIEALAPHAVLARHFGAVMHFARATRVGEHRPLIHGDFSLNVTNSITAAHLLGLGLESVTASHDLNQTQLVDLLRGAPRGRVAITLHHHISTFHNSHCVYAHLLSTGSDYRSCGRPCEAHRLALRDFAGHDHPVVVDVSCRNTVFNALAQSAAPLVPQLLELGVRRFRVEFVWERSEEVQRTLTAYRQLLAGALSVPDALRAASVHERYGITTPLRAPRRPLPISSR